MSFDQWRSLVDGAEIDVGSDIPDSAIWQIDAREIDASDGDTITTITDQIGDNDATGGDAVFRESGVNENPSLEFDGVDNDYSAPVSVDQPHVIFAVVETFGGTSDQQWIAGDTETTHGIAWNDEGNWTTFAGDNLFGSADNSKQLITGVFDSPDNQIRENGNQENAGDSGPRDISELSIGVRAGDEGDYWDGYIGFVELHDSGWNQELADREQQILSEWGI